MLPTSAYIRTAAKPIQNNNDNNITSSSSRPVYNTRNLNLHVVNSIEINRGGFSVTPMEHSNISSIMKPKSSVASDRSLSPVPTLIHGDDASVLSSNDMASPNVPRLTISSSNTSSPIQRPASQPLRSSYRHNPYLHHPIIECVEGETSNNYNFAAAKNNNRIVRRVASCGDLLKQRSYSSYFSQGNTVTSASSTCAASSPLSTATTTAAASPMHPFSMKMLEGEVEEEDVFDGEEDVDTTMTSRQETDATTAAVAAGGAAGAKKKRRAKNKLRKFKKLSDLPPSDTLTFLPPPPPPLGLTSVPPVVKHCLIESSISEALCGHLPFVKYCALLQRWYERVVSSESDYVQQQQQHAAATNTTMANANKNTTNTPICKRGADVALACPRREHFITDSAFDAVLGDATSANTNTNNNDNTTESRDDAETEKVDKSSDESANGKKTLEAGRVRDVVWWAAALARWWVAYVYPHTSRPRFLTVVACPPMQPPHSINSLVTPNHHVGHHHDFNNIPNHMNDIANHSHQQQQQQHFNHQGIHCMGTAPMNRNNNNFNNNKYPQAFHVNVAIPHTLILY